jgi:hypothetical protein
MATKANSGSLVSAAIRRPRSRRVARVRLCAQDLATVRQMLSFPIPSVARFGHGAGRDSRTIG